LNASEVEKQSNGLNSIASIENVQPHGSRLDGAQSKKNRMTLELLFGEAQNESPAGRQALPLTR